MKKILLKTNTFTLFSKMKLTVTIDETAPPRKADDEKLVKIAGFAENVLDSKHVERGQQQD